jgi:plastocyanin
MAKRLTAIALTAVLAAAVLQVSFAAGAGDPGAVTARKTVNLGDNFFSPRRSSARRGEIVRFVWTGSDRHNVRGYSGQRFNSGFSGKTSGRFRIRARARRGTRIRFVCDFHPSEMRGSIRVR